MAIKPILFNTDMVRAILEGKKTQTRRLVKPHYHVGDAGFNVVTMANTGAFCYIEYYDADERSTERRMNPPYNRDDILWVRETWYKDVSRYMYRANYSENEKFFENGNEVPMIWHPSIHMPKEAARIFLRVKDVRAERLQDITEKDIRAEGSVDTCCMCGFNRGLDDHKIDCSKGIERAVDCPLHMMHPDIGFFGLWDSTIPKGDRELYGWAANPFVWVISFVRVDKPAGWGD